MPDRRLRVRRVVAAHPGTVDALLAVLAFAAAVGSHFLAIQATHDADPTFATPRLAPTVIALAATALPLAFRRRAPLAALLASTLGFALGQFVGVAEGNVTALILATEVYNAARYGTPRRRTNATCSASLALIVAVLVIQLYGNEGQPTTLAFDTYVAIVIAFNVALFCAMWGLGASIASGRRRAALLAEQAEELRRERQANAARAVFAERVRIARELHDVVAHHVSLMGLQAGAARLVMDRDSGATRDALASIEASSRQAVAELQSLLVFLRQEGEDDAGAHPGLAQLPALAASLQSLGLDVRLALDAARVAPGSTVDTSAYRIVQEALTNTLKHASASLAEVKVRCDRDVLHIEVVDDGSAAAEPAEAAAAPRPGGGLGLIGMRERAVLHGGQLTAGPSAGGGFAVHAQLPMQGSPA